MAAEVNHRMRDSQQHRVIAYVDGFNLYYGLRDAKLRRYYWLNLESLAQNLLKPYQQLLRIKYFTARISGGRRGHPHASVWEDKRRRQSLFLEALGTLPRTEIFEGHFLGKLIRCKNCGDCWSTYEEKMTDVRIATEMLMDACADRFDVAMLISADSDLVPPIEAIRSLFPEKAIVAAFPPCRNSEQLRKAAHACFTIGEARLRQSQFPDQVLKPDGYLLERPAEWR